MMDAQASLTAAKALKKFANLFDLPFQKDSLPSDDVMRFFNKVENDARIVTFQDSLRLIKAGTKVALTSGDIALLQDAITIYQVRGNVMGSKVDAIDEWSLEKIGGSNNAEDKSPLMPTRQRLFDESEYSQKIAARLRLIKQFCEKELLATTHEKN